MFKKFNWGWGIAIVYSSFVLTFLAFLAYTTTQKVELVSEDYYNSELTYQSRMNAINRGKSIEDKINFNLVKNNLTFNLPFDAKNITDGKIKLYRPSNSKLDKQFEIKSLLNQNNSRSVNNYNNNTDSMQISNNVSLNLEKFEKGLWKVQVEWSILDSNYYFEKTVFL